jgi:hypothetical protein
MTMKKMLKKLIRREKGQALPIVLILMVLGGLIVAPLLSYTTSGLKVSQVYEGIADEFYAADAGIEDGLWQIKYEHLDNLFSNYERYDYDTTYDYPITYPVDVNSIEVDIEIENVWIPDISEPANLDEANRLAETDKFIIAGCVSAELTQQVKIHYKQEAGDPDLFITSIGVWLPPGFSYDELGEESQALAVDLANAELSYSWNNYPHKGGEAVVWTFTEPAPFTAFPGVETMDIPMTCSLTFNFTRDDPTSQRNPEAVSWLTASGVADFPYTWDADVRVFHINSVANGAQGTTIDAYAIKSDPRQLVSGIEGDYRAVGNTLMLNLYPDWFGPVRDHLLDDSDATVDDIPANAYVKSALLVWSAWLIAEEEELTIFADSCVNIYEYWNPGSDWSDYWQYGTRAYRAHHSYYHGDDDRELVLKEAIPLSIYQSAILSFEYWDDGRLEYNDCLKYAFSSDGGGTWSGWNEVFCDDTYGGTATVPIPEEYLTANFKIKFMITDFDDGGMGGTEYCYLDNIEITAKIEEETVADTEVRFEIDGEQVYLAEDVNGDLTIPTQGTGNIFANQVRVVANEDTAEDNDYSYCCRTDVTTLVQAYADHGNATYTVGDVEGTLDSQWSYAGWSLVIIYYSPETQRHYLYMSDIEEFRYIAPNGPGISFPISGFLVPDPISGETTAATITCFLGDGDDYYSGDFIAINAPEGLEGPEIPNSYKLWDRVTLYAEYGWPQPRMDNLEFSPNNVWNGRSAESGGSFIDGVDIDTFYVPWGDPPSDGLLKPGDSSATITLNFAGSDLYTAELLNFIYIIIAFRSETVTGGTVTYLIEG